MNRYNFIEGLRTKRGKLRPGMFLIGERVQFTDGAWKQITTEAHWIFPPMRKPVGIVEQCNTYGYRVRWDNTHFLKDTDYIYDDLELADE